MDRPILFSGPMVRALLAGTKSQTRRVLRLPPTNLTLQQYEAVRFHSEAGWQLKVPRFNMWVPVKVPVALGDRLYVREAWRAWSQFDHLAPSNIPANADVQYVADAPLSPWDCRFRQGMHMPRWASRLTLTVTDVRVHRLQEISEADAIAEGVGTMPGLFHDDGPCPVSDPDCLGDDGECHDACVPVDARTAFSRLWDSINAKRGYAWSTNQWVVALTFTVEHRNIDAEAVNA